MRYGWYLLDERRRELLLTNVGEEIVPYGPFHVEFHPSARMRYDRFRELVGELAALNLAGASFGGGIASSPADPLAHPHFADMLRDLISRGVVVTDVETTAVGLDDRTLRALLDTGVRRLTVDLGEIDPERHARVTGAPEGSLDRIVAALAAMRDIRNRRGWHLPKVVCTFRLRPGNFEHTARMVQLSRELEVSHVVLDLAEDKALAFTPDEYESACTALASTIAEAPEGYLSGTALDPDALLRAVGATAAPAPGQLPPLVYCGAGSAPLPRVDWSEPLEALVPWFHALVDASFHVWPSRALATSDRKPLGSAAHSPFSAVWNAPAARALRREFAGAILDRPRDERPLPAVTPGDYAGADVDAVFAQAEARLGERRAGFPVRPVAPHSHGDGFDVPRLKALGELFPRSRFEGGRVETVERIHAEAEIARIEGLRLRVLSAQRDAESQRLLREPDGVPASEAARIEAGRLRAATKELDDYAERLFAEAGILCGIEAVTAAPPPFDSMQTWLRRIAERDPSVDVEVDENYVVWMSLFQTLADNTNPSELHRALGIGVGHSGPEHHYNDFFAEHYAVDLVDYSSVNPKLKFIVANIEEGVDFPDARFDLVYSHSVFEHLKDVTKAVGEIDRLVALGKYVYLTISPLYYSPTGSHVNVPRRLTNWEHLYPDSEYYLLDTPHEERKDTGFYLNKLTIAEFLAAIGKVGWEIRHFSVGIVHPRDVPQELKDQYPLVDLVVRECRFIGRKVIPKSTVEW